MLQKEVDICAGLAPVAVLVFLHNVTNISRRGNLLSIHIPQVYNRHAPEQVGFFKTPVDPFAPLSQAVDISSFPAEENSSFGCLVMQSMPVTVYPLGVVLYAGQCGGFSLHKLILRRFSIGLSACQSQFALGDIQFLVSYLGFKGVNPVPECLSLL